MLDIVQQFIEKYYINPIIYDTMYNPITAITWFTIILISIFLALKLFSLIGVKINESFIIAVTPYIIFTSILRVFEDTGTIQPPLKYLLLTPIFYEVTLFIIVFSVLLTKGIAQRLKIPDWHVLFVSMGIILSMASLALLLSVWDMGQPEIFLWIWGLGTVLALIIYGICGFFDFSLVTNRLNALIIWAHLLNSLSIYIWLDSIFHKATLFHQEYKWTYIVLPLLWTMDNKFRNKDSFRNIVKLSILFIGLAAATRNTLRLILGI